MTGPVALRGPALRLRHDPFLQGPEDALESHPDALVVMEGGRITAFADHASERAAHPPDMPVTHHPHRLIVAGFVDAHVHYPQVGMIGAYGETLLSWLRRYTFPEEARFADPAVARRAADLFLAEMLRAGTTTAAVYCTVHAHSVEALFAAAQPLGLRLIAGKVLMDRNAPDELLDGPDLGIPESEALIARWHGRGRLAYAVTPRFAPSCTPEQLAAAGRLWRGHPGTYLQTHLAETREECDWVRDLFGRDTLDAYAEAGLVGPRAVFGHAIHLDERDWGALHAGGCGVAHCPSSNLFLGSGAFPLFTARRADRPVRVGIGSDVGAGTSLSALRTLGDGYKVAVSSGARLTAAHGLWLATRGGAEALHLADRIGDLAVGMEADLVVLDPAATPLLARRVERSEDDADRLFAMMTLGDERCVRETWVAGRRVHGGA
jgi:guanine deaminase